MVAFRLQTVALCRLSEALLARNTTTVLDFCAVILHTKLFPRIISARQHESASPWFASIAQLVEHRSRKAGVIGSSPIAGSSCNVTPPFGEAFFVLRNPASVISSPLHRVLSLQRIRFHRPSQKLFDLLQFDGMDSPASRKKCAISVRTSGFCWKTRLGGARQLGFCRARAAVYPAKRESGAEMAHFFQRAALARNGKAGRCASPSLCVLRFGLKLQLIEKIFVLGCRARWARFVDAPRNHSEASTR